jgi:hypothetical protein
LTSADVPRPSPTGDALARPSPSGDVSRRPAGTLVLLALLFLLAGGVFYAAVAHKPAPVERVESLAGRSDDEGRSGFQPDETRPESDRSRRASRAGKPDPPEKARPESDQVGEINQAGKPDRGQEARPESGQIGEAGDAGKPELREKAAGELAEPPPAEPLGLYSERTRADRKNWIGAVGGTPESELGVADGLDWLARHQAEDGHWGPDCLGAEGSRCEKEHPCGGPGGKYEAALTGLAVLAFQAGGNYDFNGRAYTENVRRGLDWLVARQGANGELVGSLNPTVSIASDRVFYNERYMYEHAIATFALAEACAVARAAQRHPAEKYLAAAIKAVGFIQAQQHDDGGWRYRPVKSDRSDTSISGWAMLALKTAKEADLKVNPATISKMTAFFKQMANPLTGRTRYIGQQHVSDATTGVGMMVDELFSHQSDSALVRRASDYLAGQAEARWGGDEPEAPDFYLWYNCTLAMFLAGGDPWDRWNNVVRNHVVSLQIRGSDCTRGSWEPEGQWASEGGRIFSTSLAVLTLEVYYRFARHTPRQE